MSPLLSIIIPVYNAENYLGTCIDSILCQETLSFELLLINDGSTDNTPEICDKYAYNDKRIAVFHINNGGVSKARNYGLEQAKGEYISFIDSDDFVSENYLETIKKQIDNNSDIIVYNYIRWISETRQECGRFNLKNGTNRNINLLYKEAVILEIVSLSVCCATFKKSIIDSYHIRFNEKMKTCEDFMFSLNYYQHIQNFTAINAPIYYYRQNLNSATGKRSLQHGFDYQMVFNEIHQIFNTHHFDEKIKKTFQHRWTRWIIAIVANFQEQKISKENMEKVIYSQAYYAAILQFSPQGILNKLELWLLKNKHSKGITIYLNILMLLKSLLKRYRL